MPGAVPTATVEVDGGAGGLDVIKNYTGDVMNFRLAVDKATERGMDVASVVVNDDVAVFDSEHAAGRRGTGVTVFVEKIAGARAAAGGSLGEVRSVAARVSQLGRSFGVALTSCVTPSSGRPRIDLGLYEVEFGVGIQGEPGRQREPVQSASELAERMVSAILEDLKPSTDAPLLPFVNGFGGNR